MPRGNTDERIRTLTGFKSNLILRAEASKEQGATAQALPLFLAAAEAELELAGLFASRHQDRDAQVSWLSAASCFIEARQFQRALPVLQRVREVFPEAEQMIQECEGKADQPILGDSPEVRMLIRLLLQKGIITEAEWAAALETAPAP